jgi:hypothetical protein
MMLASRLSIVALLAIPAALHAASPTKLADFSPAERAKILGVAGFVDDGGTWKGCDGMSELIVEDDWIDGGTVRDLNGDGSAEVIVGGSGIGCYGHAGQGYTVLRSTPSGWTVVDEGAGIPHFLTTRGKDAWLDMEVGGPGFCFPVMRWNGTAYALLRHQYGGKACKP